MHFVALGRRLLAVTAALLVATVAPTEASTTTGFAQATTARKAAIIRILHRKAKKALVNVAQDKAFARYFRAPDAAHRHEVKSRIDRVSLTVQSRFHVAEMCLIDKSGPELSRIVGQSIASDLSPDESGAGFFRPAFATPRRRVYITRIYLSPDADRWVVAYATPITIDGRNEAILHYEHDLGYYQRLLNKDVSGTERFVLAVTDEGWVISDSRRPVSIEKKKDAESPGDYFPAFRFGGRALDEVTRAVDAGSTLSDGTSSYRAAYVRVGRWTILAFEHVVNSVSR